MFAVVHIISLLKFIIIIMLESVLHGFLCTALACCSYRGDVRTNERGSASTCSGIHRTCQNDVMGTTFDVLCLVSPQRSGRNCWESTCPQSPRPARRKPSCDQRCLWLCRQCMPSLPSMRQTVISLTCSERLSLMLAATSGVFACT